MAMILVSKTQNLHVNIRSNIQLNQVTELEKHLEINPHKLK